MAMDNTVKIGYFEGNDFARVVKLVTDDSGKLIEIYNLNCDGEWIEHIPGQKYLDTTEIKFQLFTGNGIFTGNGNG
jgi:hypothetical protein